MSLKNYQDIERHLSLMHLQFDTVYSFAVVVPLQTFKKIRK